MGEALDKGRRTARMRVGKLWFFLLGVVGCIAAQAVFALPALASGKVPDWEITSEKAPELDYTLSAGTAVLTFGLLIAFFVMLFVLSEREFKGVINERFGPKK
jgi:hypothetical protein